MSAKLVACAAPPTCEQVLRALAQLEPLDVAAAAAHLLSPTSVSVGRHIRLDGTRMTFRGRSADTGGTWAHTVGQVAKLVSACAAETDGFLDLTSSPASWLKLVRSGAYVHLAGSGELFAGQHVTFDPRVPAGAAWAVAELVAGGGALRAGTLHLAGVALLVRADPGAAHLEPC